MPKPSVPLVETPTLQGSWHGHDATVLGFKMMLRVLVVTLVYVIVSILFSFDALALRILMGLLVVTAASFYLYAGGLQAGVADAAFGEIMFNRQAEGKIILPAEKARCFHPAKGFWIALIGVLPFVCLTCAYAVQATPERYTLGLLPDWLKGAAQQQTLGEALRYYANREGLSALAILRIGVRALVMPFINVAVKMGGDATLWAERLSPLWVLLAPLGYGFGYVQGKKQRAKIHASIAAGVQKKLRRERKERRARARQNKPEQLI